ncbi:hypothetical protein LTR91_002071 [Friedmanniomyces endolithicus]|uniref:Uncharacterized protein n=1 Tax=Friedmanniomyces endolithicus TaxID=329885 RepID=A0AAN6L144_9PEZI|nr:hypothetical protein LTR82_005149 [Friedmanniomyces endolithicus]KAK0926606.1 hypothetical protein LTR57_004061 [Friedmanniomyces endolithicus]KAK0981594.1 hypothetical protein LTR54_014920 [Friedmanniomyces endolithicus]KAK0993905.1 hypothetical protein LTS01_007322 [Friedmanniomyces endolithicus]KAK1011600.1 hypothetical protein LTR91_002071 [Friedmanniomyces endolithicus]
MGAPESDQRPPPAHGNDNAGEAADHFEDMADNEERDYAPPPHLAARFYRNRANTRRKSSAASSRRNSLSSAHSRASSVSHRRGSGCQSNYIAQHLRRASIIESRKARLADRAAHAEQVRLRAALVKAAPRGSVSASEERALAAQVAKEKYLAKVAAACAEEVARAKRVAEEVKERKLLEEARQRLEIEERHAEVEKRRNEFPRNLHARRARRASSSEKKLAVVQEDIDVSEEAIEEEATPVLDQEGAALRIQRAWRLSRRRAVIYAFAGVGLGQAKETSFEDFTALIAQTDVIDISTAMLTQLGLQETGDEHAALNTRTFLSTYLMTAHPVSVLTNKNGAQEQDLLAKATELMSNVEHTLSRLSPRNMYSPGGTQLETLSQSYTAYTSAFAAWRLQDSSVLIEGMVASFVELDAIWQTVKDDERGEVSADYREGIRDNQVMLLSRIRKLAGADRADTLIKKAIRESRRRRPKKRNAAEVRPRGVEPPTIAREAAASTVSTEAALDDSDALVELSEPRSATDVTRQLFTPMPSNRVLTHELAIDKDYKLTDTQAALRDDLYRSICAAMKQGFEAGDGAQWTVSAAENVREKLLRMLKPGNSMHTLISESLDLQLIAKQCRAGVFSYEGFFNFMANVLPKLCAPFRDEEIALLASQLQEQPSPGDEVDAMINKLFKLLRAVDALSLDYTNFMIMNAAPTLIREAPGYEQRAFASDLAAGRISLTRTKRWWHAAHRALATEADRRDPDNIRLAADRPKPEKIYARALVDLALESNSPLTPDTIPETLHLDLARLRSLRAAAIRITAIGAVLLTAKNLLKRDVRAQWKTQAARLWLLLAADDYSTVEQHEEGEASAAGKALGVLESGNNMPGSTKVLLAGAVGRVFSQAAAAATATGAGSGGSRFTDPVLKVLFQRLRTHVLTRLSAETSGERVRAAASASEVLTSCGLGEMVGQVGEVVEVLERVRGVDWRSHGGWYGEIVGEGGER